jgi:hypothetical protein
VYSKGLGEKLGLGKLSRTSTEALGNYDNSMRLALYDHLKAKGMDEPTIAGHIRSTMGDYSAKSQFVKTAQGIGASFPGWRAGVVPRAMLKAVKEQPKNVKAYTAASGDIENDKPFPGQNGAGFSMGSVPEDWGEMIAPPAGTLAYGTSPSTIGPMATAEQAKQATTYGELGKFAEQQIQNYVPFGSIISKVPADQVARIPGVGGALSKLPLWDTRTNESQANPILQGVGSVFGMRFPDEKNLKARKKQLEEAHMSKADIWRTLAEEGYLHQDSPLGK